VLPIESMDDIELKSIQLQFPSSLRVGGADNACQENYVHTDRGDLMVALQGDRTKPAILTYHDIGLNLSRNSSEMMELITIYSMRRVLRMRSVPQLFGLNTFSGQRLRKSVAVFTLIHELFAAPPPRALPNTRRHGLRTAHLYFCV
ncbi:jg6901, partial [Pararge aegeria aegeria]